MCQDVSTAATRPARPRKVMDLLGNGRFQQLKQLLEAARELLEP
jgi:hypothetical protein